MNRRWMLLRGAGAVLALLAGLPALRAASDSSLWSRGNLAAWCAAPPWDAKGRDAEQRAQMLESLGFTMFAFNWRPRQIPTFDAEIEALQRHHIKLIGWAVYGAGNPAAPAILAAFRRHGVHTQLWDMETGIKPAATPQEQEARIDTVVRRLLPLAKEAEACGCEVELYNHNGWCGLEDNELAVIARLRSLGVKVGMVYNFSHARDVHHDDPADFAALWGRIKSHVVEVNLTGIGPHGEELYPSQGECELGMMRVIQDSGWRGPVGLIAEKGGDAAVTLRKYLTGLDWLAAELKRPGSGGPRPFGLLAAPVADPYADWAELDRRLGRAAIPEYQVIRAASADELTPTDNGDSRQDFRNWEVSQGDPGDHRYSALDQINRSNVGGLRQAWTYHSADGRGYLQCNPVIVDGVLFAPTVGRAIVALDAASGRELWRHQLDGPRVPGLEDAPARRGLVYWAGEPGHGPRLVFSCGKWVYALDPKTGKPLREFGDQGRAPLPTGGTASGVVWKDTFVIPGLYGDIFAYDLGTGTQKWRFHTVPQPGEFGYDTWIGSDREGADCWGGLALDEDRAIVYAAIGDPHPNFIGVHRMGEDLFSDTLVALDVKTGRLRWYFQNVHHDLWDSDDPAPPNLITVTMHGRRVDAVACVTKLGDTLLLDRVSGKPLFPFRLRRAPTSVIAGEVTSPYQPDPQLPEPFSSEEFRLADVTDRTPAAHDFVLRQARQSTFGWFVPPTFDKPMLYRSSRGGAEWTGACVDVPSGRLYVSSNRVVSDITLHRSAAGDGAGSGASAGGRIFAQDCAMCHGANRQGLGMVPSLLGLRNRMTDAQVLALLKTGRAQMPPAPAMSSLRQRELLDFLMGRDRPKGASSRAGSRRAEYYIDGFNFLQDEEGYPGIRPPWGLLTCLDLNTGRIQWQVPLGVYDALVKQGLGVTGTENFGGPTVTAGGLVFCGGTQDREVRAFDKDTGRELWSAKLPWGGYAPPTVYEAHGREFVVIAATGGGKLGGPTGDAYVAFALPPPARR